MQLPAGYQPNLTQRCNIEVILFLFFLFFVSLPLYFRFNFSLFVAAPANGDAGGRGEGEEGALHGADRKLHEHPVPCLPLSSS